MRFVPLSLTILGLLTSTIVHAQNSGSSPIPAEVVSSRLRTLLGTPEYDKEVSKAASSAFQALRDCAEATVVRTGQQPNVMNPLQISADLKLTSGAILERMRVSGCGKSMTANVITFGDGRQNKSVSGMPGTTMADPRLVHDTLPHVFNGASALIGQCKKVRFVDTRVADEFSAKPLQPGQRWREIWTIDICGEREVEVPVDYIPNQNGTAIAVTSLRW